MKVKISSFCCCSATISSVPGFIIFLFDFHIHQLVSAQFRVIGPDQPVTAIVGEDIVLPCHLSPRMSAENMEVIWFQSQLSQFVHRYSDGKDQTEDQTPEYQGRTVFLRDSIANGSVSLRIHNIRPSDEGQYRCFVQSLTFYNEATLELKVAALGSDPQLSVEGYQNGGIRVVCQSIGWYPEPQVLWRDPSGQHLPSLSETSRVDDDLFEAQTTVIIRENSNQKLSCCVWNSHFNQEKESTIYVSDVFFPKVSLWIVALCVILVVLFVCIGLVVYLFKMKEKLAAELRWRRVLAHSENVIVDPDTAHPQLILSEDWKRVRWGDTRQDLPNNPERFDSRACVLGHEGFTSGSHYWEVEVGDGRGWAVGVARESVKRKGWIKRNPEEGIWAVDYEWSGHYRALTSPRTCLPLSEVLRKLGIYLDYERGQVTVFDADKEAPIFTFPTASFNRERVFPLLWLWGTESELRLCS
ncbi:butyrophilin subfamily 1 member A1 isoform X1 [Chelonia mydas]|uniref:butyrophilin subfamily 1 member A1 isoform X1 n=1 Tax=Chelonia mydas TaxID=8469 RepID=UPI001CA9E7BA|nr:butyrophilin subfamily 1 member A1 isoform X1 [Chelonia mydas]